MWNVDTAVMSHPKPKKSPKKSKKNQTPSGEAPLLPPVAPCTVSVEKDLKMSAAPSDDPQRIFHASMTGPAEVLIAYGSSVKPTFTKACLKQADGTWMPSLSLPRAAEGIFTDAGGSNMTASGKKGKRSREAQLAAVDAVLPQMNKRGVGQTATIVDKTAADDNDSEGARMRDDQEDDREADDADGAHEGSGDLGAHQREAVSTDVGGLPTFGQRLRAMEAVAPMEEAAKVQSGSAAKRKPTAASQVSLLVQALQNGDAAMLDEALQIQVSVGCCTPAVCPEVQRLFPLAPLFSHVARPPPGARLRMRPRSLAQLRGCQRHPFSRFCRRCLSVSRASLRVSPHWPRGCVRCWPSTPRTLCLALGCFR